MTNRIFIETEADYADPLGLDTKPGVRSFSLSADELAALRTFADANGRRWKSKLNEAWSSCRYDRYNGADNVGQLQYVRNMFGPSWLVRFSFDNVNTHRVSFQS